MKHILTLLIALFFISPAQSAGNYASAEMEMVKKKKKKGKKLAEKGKKKKKGFFSKVFGSK